MRNTVRNARAGAVNAGTKSDECVAALSRVARWVWANRRLVAGVLLAVLAVALLAHACSAGHSLAFAVIAGVEGGKHVVDGPLTTDVVTGGDTDNFLLNEIDREVVKIRPMATPVDQLSRLAGARHSGSMVVDYYNVDTKPTTAKLLTTLTVGTAPLTVKTDNDDMFDVSDTILVQGVKGVDAEGEATADDLVLYVDKKGDGGLGCVAVNGPSTNDDSISVPAATTLIRMGRAATELDVQTPQFEALPKKATQHCQIFKAQVEQSVLQAASNKEAGWTLNDQSEAAIYDMRLGMEKSFLFGHRAKIYDRNKHESVYLTGGIWQQAGKEFSYDASAFSEETLVDLMREAFTGNAGSKRKVLIGGSAFISRLNKISYSKVVSAGDNVVKWGIDFSEVRSKFGTLYVLLSEVFDECGMADEAMIIDPEYLQKYSHLPFGTEALNLKASGQRNTDAIVLTEASCLVLRYPKAHVRVVKA